MYNATGNNLRREEGTFNDIIPKVLPNFLPAQSVTGYRLDDRGLIPAQYITTYRTALRQTHNSHPQGNEQSMQDIKEASSRQLVSH
jgi:hypothetical protein